MTENSTGDTRTKVTIVAANLSTNCTNRCYRLAQSLAGRYRVEIVGTTFGVGTRWGEGIWPPLAGERDVPIRSVRGDLLPFYAKHFVDLLRLMDGDVIIACKARAPSLGAALLKRFSSGTPVVLDTDDDELAQTLPGRQAPLRRWLADVTGYFWTRLVHPLHRFADGKLVVSELFRSRYGGVLAPHPMDPRELDPARFDSGAVRSALGIEATDTVFGFVGTPGRQKGTDMIFDAIARIGRPDVRVLIVGIDEAHPEITKYRERLGRSLIAVPPQPVARIPEFLAAVDAVLLPQRNVEETAGQMPAKLTDAMAMGKVVIAARRSDIPVYLENCGLLFEPDDTEGLLGCMRSFLENPASHDLMGTRARRYFLEHLTLEKVGAAVSAEIDRVLSRRRDRKSRS